MVCRHNESDGAWFFNDGSNGEHTVLDIRQTSSFDIVMNDIYSSF